MLVDRGVSTWCWGVVEGGGGARGDEGLEWGAVAGAAAAGERVVESGYGCACGPRAIGQGSLALLEVTACWLLGGDMRAPFSVRG